MAGQKDKGEVRVTFANTGPSVMFAAGLFGLGALRYRRKAQNILNWSNQ